MVQPTRSRTRQNRSGRPGFTLVEILVTLVLIALLVGVVLPAVIRQLDRGEPTRVAQDLESIRTAVQMFRIDVRRFPGTPEQLVRDPEDWEDDSGFPGGSDIPQNLIDRWDGPYLEVGHLEEVAPEEPMVLVIAMGIQSEQEFDVNDINGVPWLTLEFTGVDEELARGVSEIVDGNDGLESGRIRWASDTLTYYIVSVGN